MGRQRIQIQGFVILLLASVCFADIGDFEPTDNIILNDGKYIGLGPVGRIVFNDDTQDTIVVNNSYLGVSNLTFTPSVQLHVKFGSSPSTDIKELLRLERMGDDDDGQSGIGLSQTFYLENQSGVINRVGALIWEYPTVSSNPDPSRFSLECHTGDGGLKNLMRQQDEWLGFLDTSSGYYMWISPAVTGTDHILAIDMDGEDRQINWTGGAAAGSHLEVEALSKVNQDLTTDATVAHNILTLTGTLDVDGVTTIKGIGGNGLIGYDLKIGDTTTPDYGLLLAGDSAFGRVPYNAMSMDLDGSVIIRNLTAPATSNIEFAFLESGGTSIRFALAVSAEGNATLNSRSLLIAGPSVWNDEIVTVGYWQTNNNIFHNLDCNTSVTGADLGVQNDLEVEGDIFVDSIKESTTGAGVTIAADIVAQDATFDTLTFDMTQDYKFVERSTILTLQGQSTGNGSALELFNFDADGTDISYFGAYGQGSPSDVTNSEFIFMGINSTTGFLYTGETGTGDALGLEIGVAGDTDLLSLAANALTVNGTVAGATGSTFGNLTLADGSITDSSNAIDFGNEALSTSGNVTLEDIIHTGDSDTTIIFGTDSIAVEAGGERFITITESPAPIDSIGFNSDNANIDVFIDGDTSDNVFRTDATNENVTINGTTLSANYDLALRGDGVLALKETTTPTADSGFAKIYTTSDNILFFQDGAGVEHLLHGDSFSTIWFHGTSTVEVTISAIDTFTLIDSFTVVGNEDDLSNAIGNTTTNTITLSSNSGGEYKVTYHGSVTATGGADKEMIFVYGIVLATPKDITNVTDDTVTPIVITSTAHGLDNGDMVEIAGVLVNTAANGSFIVDSKATDTFEIVALDGNATTGNGDYDEGSPTGDITIEYPGQMVVHRMVRGADLGAMSATGIHELANSDVISLYVANVSGTTNLTVAAISLGLDRIGD